MMAPDVGSGRWPAWMARVPKAAARSSSKTRVMAAGLECGRAAGKLTRARTTGESGMPRRDDAHHDTIRERSVTHAMHEAHPTREPHPPAGDAAVRHCLVTDDEPRLRRVLCRLMETDGFTCLEAGSGAEALAQLERTPVPI